MELEKYRAKAPGDAFELALSEISEGTAKLYRRWFSNFLAFAESTPEELLVFHEENRGAVRRAVLGYQRHLVEEYCKHSEKCNDFKKGCRCERWEGLHPNSAKFVGKAVSKFLSANDFDDFRMRDKSGIEGKGKRVLLKEQVASLYEDCGKSRRLRAIVMTLKDTGLRVGDLAQLKVEDFNGARRIKDDNGEFRAWSEPITTGKNGVNAYIHLGPESIKALEDYIGNRTEGAIFLTERSMPRKDGTYTQPGEPMKGINVTTCMRTLCKHLKSRGFNVSAHSLRKFFFTYLATKMELSYVKVLAGKKLPPTDAPYLQAAQTGELTRLYVENYEAIRIFKHTDIDKELETSKQRIESLEQEVEALRRDRATTQEIQVDREETITLRDIKRYRRIQQLESQYEDTDEGFAKLTKALNELDEEQ